MTDMHLITPEFRLQREPLRCPGCYDLDLYCKYDNPDHGYGEFPHIPSDCQTRSQAVRAAKRQGWILHDDGTGTCPKCAAKLKSGSIPLTAAPIQDRG